MTVPVLFTFKFPTFLNGSTILPDARRSVCDTPAQWDVVTLRALPFPPKDWCTTAELHSKNIWGAGGEVVLIQHPMNTSKLFLIWIVEYWAWFYCVLYVREQWKMVVDWVLMKDASPGQTKVLDLIGWTNWGLDLWVLGEAQPGMQVGEISQLLSFGWLQEVHMDTTTTYLNVVANCGWWASNIALAECLQVFTTLNDENRKASSTLHNTQHKTTVHRAKRILLPVNLYNSHWVVVHVDIKERRVTYGV